MLKNFKKLGLLLSVLAVGGCSRVIFGTVNAPSYFSDMVVYSDITYNQQTSQKLDIYAPREKMDVLKPVIVFYYGGRWTDGKKSDYRFVADRLVREGYVVVIPDYRKFPDVKFPAFVDDSADAVAWISKNIETYGGFSDQLYLIGHSSGAHIAGLLVTDKRYLKDRDVDFKSIRAFVGLAGPYAFTPEDDDLKEMFGPPENYPAMRATTFVDGTEPPMLLLLGGDDTLVAPFNAQRLADKIKGSGGVADIKSYPDVNHFEIIGAFTWVKKSVAPVPNDAIKFFKTH